MSAVIELHPRGCRIADVRPGETFQPMSDPSVVLALLSHEQLPETSSDPSIWAVVVDVTYDSLSHAGQLMKLARESRVRRLTCEQPARFSVA